MRNQLLIGGQWLTCGKASQVLCQLVTFKLQKRVLRTTVHKTQVWLRSPCALCPAAIHSSLLALKQLLSKLLLIKMQDLPNAVLGEWGLSFNSLKRVRAWAVNPKNACFTQIYLALSSLAKSISKNVSMCRSAEFDYTVEQERLIQFRHPGQILKYLRQSIICVIHNSEEVFTEQKRKGLKWTITR